MTENGPGLHRQQALYWNKMVELKVAASYVHRYRDHLGNWVTGVASVRAVASSSSIALWAIWREHALIWGGIIATAQVLDAIKDVFPIAKRYKAASEHTVALDRLVIDAQMEWEGIFSGVYTDDQIRNRLHKLRRLHHDAECHSFPQGLPNRKDLRRASKQDAESFFEATYAYTEISGGDNA